MAHRPQTSTRPDKPARDRRLSWAIGVAAVLLVLVLVSLHYKPRAVSARVESWTPQPAPMFPAKVLYDYRPMLRMPAHISIRPLQVETVRTAKGGLVSTVWARRAKGSIVVDWDNSSAANGNVDSIKIADSPLPQYLPPGMALWGDGETIIMKTPDDKALRLPGEQGCKVFSLALAPGHQYAFGTNVQEGGTDSILVVDTVNKKVAGTIPVPRAANGLHCIFRPNDYLMVFDYDWQWIMLLDLSKSISPAGLRTKDEQQAQ
jgi:hypothetical protein